MYASNYIAVFVPKIICLKKYTVKAYLSITFSFSVVESGLNLFRILQDHYPEIWKIILIVNGKSTLSYFIEKNSLFFLEFRKLAVYV